MLLRNSERQAFKTCRHKWQWTYRDGRQSATASTALRFGDLIHQALDAYRPPGRKFGPMPWLTFERLYHEQAERLGEQGFDVFSDDKWEPALELGIGMLRNYVDEFKARDSEYEVIASEQTFQLLIRVPAGAIGPGSRPFRFKVVGTFDGVWRHLGNRRISFKEYKTAAAIKEDGLAMDEQAGLYWTYGPKWLRQKGILKEDELPSDILYTFLRKAIRDPDATYNEQGHKLNQPKKEALLEAYAILKRPLPPRSDGKKGAPVIADLIVDLEANTKINPFLLGEPSESQPAPFFHRLPVYRDLTDRKRVHTRVCQEAYDIIMARSDLLPLYKNPGPLHMPNCRFCSVKEACEVHETGGDFESVLNASMVSWNPYAAHELPERN